MNSLLSTFEHDVNVSASEKASALKLLRTVVKNLSDPDKVHDVKFRQLRLQNPKIQTMTRHAAIMAYLTQTIGFQQVVDDGEFALKIEHIPNQAVMSSAFIQISAALERVNILLEPTKAAGPRHTLKHSGSSVSTASTASTTSTTASLPANFDQLSEKQKARLLKEQKEAQEKEEARLARKRTSAQIKADKYVRENDPNWKPGVSAAAAKAGTSMQTFRDKFGE